MAFLLGRATYTSHITLSGLQSRENCDFFFINEMILRLDCSNTIHFRHSSSLN